MAPKPEIATLRLADLTDALVQGARDFRAAPMFGLFFGGFYAFGGLLLVLLGAGTVWWTLAISLGFPLIAPFAAVGLYDVSRHLEKGEPLGWGSVLGNVWAERSRQIPLIGALIVIYFLFWTFLAHMIFALFMGLSTMTNVQTSYEVFLTSNGLAMIATEFAVGGVLAFLLFSLTAISLPMLLDREIDFVTAMILSVRSVIGNLGVMLVWGISVAVLSLLGMVPAFLGLCVIFPVLGHATWHLYRRTVIWPVAQDTPHTTNG
ncbi:DUF2189 domain-containing protein [Oceaniglobus indicus]|uniref:DUF2189 domain-containing protein n=1 Tax=Oceaniglobus indicus TaxID=2047749 RepID=UPI000C17E28D|nr:DUF2189 domain-containing protein [Oceaniglobus indicus]